MPEQNGQNGAVRELTVSEALREALNQVMAQDERVFVIGEDVGIYGGAFGVSAGLLQTYGSDRVIDTPISEAGIAGSGTGAAAQHSESLENWFVHVPGLKVVMPSNAYDAKGLLLAAIEDPNPVIFVEHKLLYKTKAHVPEEMYTIPLSQSHVARAGEHLTVIATSVMVQRALEAAKTLAEEGIELEIIDPRTLMPLDDKPIVESVIKTGRALIVHEAVKTGGFGGEIAARIVESEAFGYLEAPVRRLAALDIPIPYNRALETATVPQVQNIVDEARKLVKGEY
jgi:acetoin:2,6-dichlorophenolindophenol oxidoreductase subunit beta